MYIVHCSYNVKICDRFLHATLKNMYTFSAYFNLKLKDKKEAFLQGFHYIINPFVIFQTIFFLALIMFCYIFANSFELDNSIFSTLFQGFPTGSVVHLVMSTPSPLGQNQCLRIWHDNSKGSWYLDRMDVTDIQTGHV